MNKHIHLALIAAGWLAALPAHAGNYAMSYAVQFTAADGTPIDGAIDVRVTFYDAAIGGAPLGEPRRFQAVVAAGGVAQIDLVLGDSDWQALFPAVGAERFVEFHDETHNLTTPRQRFGVVPYALKVPVDGASLGYDATSGALRFAPTAPVDFGGQKLTGLAAPESANDAATKGYVDAAVAAINGGGGGPSGGATVTINLDNSGTSPNVTVSGSTHTIHLPLVTGAGATQGILTRSEYNALANKQDALGFTPLSAGGGALSGGLDLSGHKIANLGTPTVDGDAATKAYVDGRLAGAAIGTGAVAGDVLTWDGAQWTPESYLSTAGGTLSGDLSLGGKAITNLADPVNLTDAATKQFVDNAVAGKQATIGTSSALTPGSLTTTAAVGVTISTNTANPSELRFVEPSAGGSQYVGFKAPSNVTSSLTYELPAAGPSGAGQVLTSNVAGVLSWASPGAAPVTSVNTQTGAVVLSASDVGALAAAQAQTTPANGKIPLADTGGTIALGWLPSTLTGKSADLLDNIDSTAFVQTTRSVSAGVGLTGGGDLSANRTLSLSVASGSSIGGLRATSGKLALDTDGNITTINADTAATATTAGNVSGTVAINHGGTGATDAASAAAALLPAQATYANKFLMTNGTGLAWAAPSGLAASDGTPAQALAVDAGGNVGIGTTAPTEALEVTGNIKATGNMRAGLVYRVFSPGGQQQFMRCGCGSGLNVIGGVCMSRNYSIMDEYPSVQSDSVAGSTSSSMGTMVADGATNGASWSCEFGGNATSNKCIAICARIAN